MSAWPGTLPQSMRWSGYSEKTPDTAIRSSVDVGVDKVRRRYTSGIRYIAGNMNLTSAQCDTLDTFYQTTLNGGVDTFTMPHPRTAVTITVRFKAPPEFSGAGGIYNASISVEQLP